MHHPASVDVQTVLKAVHEAKVNLSWVNPNPEYIEALREFVARILKPGSGARPNSFLEQFEQFATLVAYFGAFNSLGQTLLKITAPGIPDIYQGTELFDFSLVDPDNRRPVNFASRHKCLEQLRQRAGKVGEAQLCSELLEKYADGDVKMWTLMQALNFRQQHAELFQSGSYTPLFATGSKAENLCAFARETGGNARHMAVVATPRMVYTLAHGQRTAPLADIWEQTEIGLPPRAPNDFVNVFTGEGIRATPARTLLCREVFARFPVALLSSR